MQPDDSNGRPLSGTSRVDALLTAREAAFQQIMGWEDSVHGVADEIALMVDAVQAPVHSNRSPRTRVLPTLTASSHSPTYNDSRIPITMPVVVDEHETIGPVRVTPKFGVRQQAKRQMDHSDTRKRNPSRTPSPEATVSHRMGRLPDAHSQSMHALMGETRQTVQVSNIRFGSMEATQHQQAPSSSVQSPSMTLQKGHVHSKSAAVLSKVTLALTADVNSLQTVVSGKAPLSSYTPGVDARVVTPFRASKAHATGTGVSTAVPVGFSDAIEAQALAMRVKKQHEETDAAQAAARHFKTNALMKATISDLRAALFDNRSRMVARPSTVSLAKTDGIVVLKPVSCDEEALGRTLRSGRYPLRPRDGESPEMQPDRRSPSPPPPVLFQQILDSSIIPAAPEPSYAVGLLRQLSTASGARMKHREPQFPVMSPGSFSSMKSQRKALAKLMARVQPAADTASAPLSSTLILSNLMDAVPSFEELDVSDKLLELAMAVNSPQVVQEAAAAGIHIPSFAQAVLQAGYRLASGQRQRQQLPAHASIVEILKTVRGDTFRGNDASDNTAESSSSPLTSRDDAEEDEQLQRFITWWGAAGTSGVRVSHILLQLGTSDASKEASEEVWRISARDTDARAHIIASAMQDERVINAAVKAGIDPSMLQHPSAATFIQQILDSNNRELEMRDSPSEHDSHVLQPHDNVTSPKSFRPSLWRRASYPPEAVTSPRVSSRGKIAGVRVVRDSLRADAEVPGASPRVSSRVRVVRDALRNDGDVPGRISSPNAKQSRGVLGVDAEGFGMPIMEGIVEDGAIYEGASGDGDDVDVENQTFLQAGNSAGSDQIGVIESQDDLDYADLDSVDDMINSNDDTVAPKANNTRVSMTKADRIKAQSTTVADGAAKSRRSTHRKHAHVEQFMQQYDEGDGYMVEDAMNVTTDRPSTTRNARFSAPDVSVHHAVDDGVYDTLTRFAQWFASDECPEDVRSEFLTKRANEATAQIRTILTARRNADGTMMQMQPPADVNNPPAWAIPAHFRARRNTEDDIALGVVGDSEYTENREELDENDSENEENGRSFGDHRKDLSDSGLPEEDQPRKAVRRLEHQRRASLAQVVKVRLNAEAVIAEAQMHGRVLMAALELSQAGLARRDAEYSAEQAEKANTFDETFDDDIEQLHTETYDSIQWIRRVEQQDGYSNGSRRSLWFSDGMKPGIDVLQDMSRAFSYLTNGTADTRAELFIRYKDLVDHLHLIEALKRSSRAAVQAAVVRQERIRWAQLTAEQRLLAEGRHGAAKAELEKRKREDKERAADPGHLTVAERMTRCRKVAEIVKAAYPYFVERIHRIVETREALAAENSFVTALRRVVTTKATAVGRAYSAVIERERESVQRECALMQQEEVLSRRREELETENAWKLKAAEDEAFRPFIPQHTEEDFVIRLKQSQSNSKTKRKYMQAVEASKRYEKLPTTAVSPPTFSATMSSRFRVLSRIPPMPVTTMKQPHATQSEHADAHGVEMLFPDTTKQNKRVEVHTDTAVPSITTPDNTTKQNKRVEVHTEAAIPSVTLSRRDVFQAAFASMLKPKSGAYVANSGKTSTTPQASPLEPKLAARYKHNDGDAAQTPDIKLLSTTPVFRNEASSKLLHRVQCATPTPRSASDCDSIDPWLMHLQ